MQPGIKKKTSNTQSYKNDRILDQELGGGPQDYLVWAFLRWGTDTQSLCDLLKEAQLGSSVYVLIYFCAQ